MRHAFSALWAVFRALFLGLIGQPDGGTEPAARGRKARQRVRVRQDRPSGPLQALGTLARTAFYAAIFQPQDGEDSPASRRRPRK